MANMAERILVKEFKALAQEKWVHIEVCWPLIFPQAAVEYSSYTDIFGIQLDNDDIFKWNVALIILNPDSLYYGGYFKASMTFPKNFPYSPPGTGTEAVISLQYGNLLMSLSGFRFLRPLYHPNIYPDGRLCISILHNPGEDQMSGELAAERWSPAQRVETVLVSILSLLDDAEVSSPANVDAGVMLRQHPRKYKSVVTEHVEASKKDIPEGFIMPTHDSTPKLSAKVDDEDFWVDSDVDDDVFGGSDSSGEEMALDDRDSGSEYADDDDDEI